MAAFAETSDQVLLRDSVLRYLARRYDFNERRKIAESPSGWSREHWADFAKLGLLGAAVSEEAGGFATGQREAQIVMQAFGRHLVIEPYLETAVLAADLILRLGSAGQHDSLLGPILAGEQLWAVALELDEVVGYAPRIVARRAGAGYRLDGHWPLVHAAPFAGRLLVMARLDDAVVDRALFVVDRDAEGLALQEMETIDGRRAADVGLCEVSVPAEARLGVGRIDAPVHAALQRAVGLQCAEAVGIMARLNEMTLEHARTRVQFGQPIGRFQVLQHRLVDMYIAHREAAAITSALAWAPPSETNAQPDQGSIAKVKVAKAAKLIGEQAIQIHGGMGMTDELAVGHYVKRLLAISAQLGDADYHLDCLADALLA
jgi:alkylation response protein AidB-like acyl-CoA dehydrogenase